MPPKTRKFRALTVLTALPVAAMFVLIAAGASNAAVQTPPPRLTVTAKEQSRLPQYIPPRPTGTTTAAAQAVANSFSRPHG